MRKSILPRGAVLFAAAAMLVTPALAQGRVIIDRGLTDDVPYTAIYPDVMQSIDDGSAETVLTIVYPDALLRCDYFSVAGAADGWSAESALGSLDVAGIESTWTPNFPGFRLSAQGVTRFADSPALIYEGGAESSPMGVPVHVIHAEAVAAGRTYALECLVEQSVAAEARPMIDFIIANFSTTSDGQCCIDPADDRG